ncbi:MAG: hypothetical protein P8N43_05580, partial [Alphaproteobacteria bacterium]|nr:hypothetical protein [Alphaproteobacteria bacterium]
MYYSSVTYFLALTTVILLLPSIGCVAPFDVDFEDTTPSWDLEPPTTSGFPECAPVASLVCGERISGDTATHPGATRLFQGYPAAVGNFGGPELMYSFVAEASEEVSVRFVDPVPSALNHDLFVLESTDGSCSPGDVELRGFNELEFEAVAGRTYFIIVDAPTHQEGAFKLELDCVGDLVYERPSDHYWQPAVGCEQAVLEGYRSCLRDEGLLDEGLKPILPLSDPYWDSYAVTDARAKCFDSHPDVVPCATLEAHESDSPELDGLTNNPSDILPDDPDDAQDELEEELADILRAWTPSVLSKSELNAKMYDIIPDEWEVCDPAVCPLSGPVFVNTYGTQYGLDYGLLANTDAKLDIAWEQLNQAEWAVDSLVARRDLLSDSMRDTAVKLNDYNESVISRLRVRGWTNIVWAAIGSTVTGSLTRWWTDGPKYYSVQRLMQTPISGPATYVGVDIALS